jgi:hypothetical protein
MDIVQQLYVIVLGEMMDHAIAWSSPGAVIAYRKSVGTSVAA